MAQPAISHLDGPESLAYSRWWLYAIGLVLIIAGVAALALPLFASLAVEVVVGWAFLVAGASQLLYAWRARGWAGMVWQLLIAAIFLVGGFTLLTNPVAGLVSLTLVVIATFLASGVIQIVIGLRLRPLDGWAWFILLGALSLLVGLLIWNSLPSSAAWSLGLLVGIDFLATGLVFLRFGFLIGRRSRTIGAMP